MLICPLERRVRAASVFILLLAWYEWLKRALDAFSRIHFEMPLPYLQPHNLIRKAWSSMKHFDL